MTREREALDWMTGRLAPGPQPAAVGQKFTAAGAVLPFAGNTFICHIAPATPAHDALVAAQEALMAGPVAKAFAFLPPSSLHMTVFEGVSDAHRAGDVWPEGMPATLPVADVTAAFAARTATLALPAATTICPTEVFAGFSVQVTGATGQDSAQLWQMRAALRDATGIRRADFGSYRFHITLAYLLRWLTDDEAAQVQALSEVVLERLLTAAPTIALGPVEYCTFEDMHAFAPQRLLTA